VAGSRGTAGPAAAVAPGALWWTRPLEAALVGVVPPALLDPGAASELAGPGAVAAAEAARLAAACGATPAAAAAASAAAVAAAAAASFAAVTDDSSRAASVAEAAPPLGIVEVALCPPSRHACTRVVAALASLVALVPPGGFPALVRTVAPTQAGALALVRRLCAACHRLLALQPFPHTWTGLNVRLHDAAGRVLSWSAALLASCLRHRPVVVPPRHPCRTLTMTAGVADVARAERGGAPTIPAVAEIWDAAAWASDSACGAAAVATALEQRRIELGTPRDASSPASAAARLAASAARPAQRPGADTTGLPWQTAAAPAQAWEATAEVGTPAQPAQPRPPSSAGGTDGAGAAGRDREWVGPSAGTIRSAWLWVSRLGLALLTAPFLDTDTPLARLVEGFSPHQPSSPSAAPSAAGRAAVPPAVVVAAANALALRERGRDARADAVAALLHCLGPSVPGRPASAYGPRIAAAHRRFRRGAELAAAAVGLPQRPAGARPPPGPTAPHPTVLLLLLPDLLPAAIDLAHSPCAAVRDGARRLLLLSLSTDALAGAGALPASERLTVQSIRALAARGAPALLASTVRSVTLRPAPGAVPPGDSLSVRPLQALLHPGHILSTDDVPARGGGARAAMPDPLRLPLGARVSSFLAGLGGVSDHIWSLATTPTTPARAAERVDAALRLHAHFAGRRQWTMCARFAATVEDIHSAAGAAVEAAFAHLLHALPPAVEAAAAAAGGRPTAGLAAPTRPRGGAVRRGRGAAPRQGQGLSRDAWSAEGIPGPWEWWRDASLLRWPDTPAAAVQRSDPDEDAAPGGAAADAAGGGFRGGGGGRALFPAETGASRVLRVLRRALELLEADPVGPWEVARGLCRTLRARAVLVDGDQAEEAALLRREAELTSRAAEVAASVAGGGGRGGAGAASVGCMPHHLVACAGADAPDDARGRPVVRRAARPSARVADVDVAERARHRGATRAELSPGMLSGEGQPGSDLSLTVAPVAVAGLAWQDVAATLDAALMPAAAAAAAAGFSPRAGMPGSPGGLVSRPDAGESAGVEGPGMPGSPGGARLRGAGPRAAGERAAPRHGLTAARLAAAAALLGDRDAGEWPDAGGGAPLRGAGSAAQDLGPAMDRAALAGAGAPGGGVVAEEAVSPEAARLLRCVADRERAALGIVTSVCRPAGASARHPGRRAALAASRCRVFFVDGPFAPGPDLLPPGSPRRPPVLRAWSRRFALVTASPLPAERAQVRVAAWTARTLSPLDAAVLTIRDAAARVAAASSLAAAAAGLSPPALLDDACERRGVPPGAAASLRSALRCGVPASTDGAPPRSNAAAAESLSRLLQGVVDAPVNQGVGSFSLLLRPGWEAAFPELVALCAGRAREAGAAEHGSGAAPAQGGWTPAELEAGGVLARRDSESLRAALCACTAELASAMLVHGRACASAMRPMHEFLVTRFAAFCGSLAPDGVDTADAACRAVCGTPPPTPSQQPAAASGQVGPAPDDAVARTIATRRGAAALAGLFAGRATPPSPAAPPQKVPTGRGTPPAPIRAPGPPAPDAPATAGPSPPGPSPATLEPAPPAQAEAAAPGLAAGGFEFSEMGFVPAGDEDPGWLQGAS